jgi:hypothetical protein
MSTTRRGALGIIGGLAATLAGTGTAAAGGAMDARGSVPWEPCPVPRPRPIVHAQTYTASTYGEAVGIVETQHLEDQFAFKALTWDPQESVWRVLFVRELCVDDETLKG